MVMVHGGGGHVPSYLILMWFLYVVLSNYMLVHQVIWREFSPTIIITRETAEIYPSLVFIVIKMHVGTLIHESAY